MNRVEFVRRQVENSGSPLTGHSTNHQKIKRGNEGERRIFGIPRKVLMSQKREERIFRQQEEWEEAKQARILGNVRKTLRGYDGVDPWAFVAEVRYLRNANIDVGISEEVLNRLLKNSGTPIS